MSIRPRTAARDDQGVTLALTAMLMVALLTFVALVVDLGNGRQAKRKVQNSVDAAALAAASVYDGTLQHANVMQSKNAALELLDANSFKELSLVADGPPTFTYSCGDGDQCRVRLAFNDADLNDDGFVDTGGKPCVIVRIDDLRVPTFFAPVIGTDALFVDAEANGCKRNAVSAAPIPAVHSTGNCSNDHEAFLTGGTGNRFVGDIHSNDGGEDSGGADTRTGTASMGRAGTIGSMSPAVGPLWLNPSPATTGVAAKAGPFLNSSSLSATPFTPLSYGPTGLRSAAARAVGLYNKRLDGTDLSPSSEIKFDSGPIPAGMYFTTNKITISGSATTVAPRVGTDGVLYSGVTLIASGDTVIPLPGDIISMSSNGLRLSPLRPSVSGTGSVLEANRITVVAGWDPPGTSCSDEGLQVSGECVRVDGIMWAPYTRLRISGNGSGHDDLAMSTTNCVDTPTFHGGVVAAAFAWSGNQGVLRGTAAGTSESPEVYLDV